MLCLVFCTSPPKKKILIITCLQVRFGPTRQRVIAWKWNRKRCEPSRTGPGEKLRVGFFGMNSLGGFGEYQRIPYFHDINMGVSKNKGYPQIIHFNRAFHYKPSIFRYPYILKTPICTFRVSIWCCCSKVRTMTGWFKDAHFSRSMV